MDDLQHVVTGRAAVWHVLPRGMRYARDAPTSIDSFVAEIAALSRHAVTVFAEPGDPSLPAHRLVALPAPGVATTLRRARFMAAAVHRATDASPIVVVQQHLPSAAAVAARIHAPVILQKHNFVRPPRGDGWFAARGAALHRRQFARLAGLTFVSEAVRDAFARDWPNVATPRVVIPNGIDARLWRPAQHREKTVLVVGRATPEKGLLEGAAGLARALADAPAWSATFAISEGARDPAYVAAVRAALAPLGERGRVFENVPPARVKVLNETAAIALIPSRWPEPFGRTCLEAHAGGAAVVSSGTGGLGEISGDTALTLPAVEAEGIAAAVSHLMREPDLRTTRAAAGRERVVRLFDLRAVAARFDAFCADIAAARVQRRG